MRKLLERLEEAAAKRLSWKKVKGDLVAEVTLHKEEGKPVSPRDKVVDVEIRVSVKTDKDGDSMGRATITRKDRGSVMKMVDGAVKGDREAKKLGEKALEQVLKETDRYIGEENLGERPREFPYFT